MTFTNSRSPGLTLLWALMMLLSMPDSSAACDKPDGLAVSALTEQSAELSWMPGDSGTVYAVEVRSKGRTPKFRWETETMASAIMVDGLLPGSTYRFRIKAHCADGSNSGSTPWQVFETQGMSPDESCPKADLLQVMNLTMNGAILAWEGAAAAAYYEVEVRSKGRTPTYFFERSQMDEMASITGLAPGGKYQFRVRTICENGASSGSTSWFGFDTPTDSMPPDTCAAPLALTLDSLGSDMAWLSWSAEEGSGFQAMLSHGDSLTDDSIMMLRDTFILLEGLKPATTYLFSLMALCGDGTSAPVFLEFTTLDSIVISDSCMDVQNLLVSMLTDTSATVEWDTVAAVQGYRLELWRQVDSIMQLESTVETTDATYLFTPLLPATSYTIKVQTSCNEGYAAGVTVDFTTTASMDSCQAPSGLMATTQDSSVLLSWSPQGLDTVQLDIRMEPGDTAIISTVVAGMSYLWQPTGEAGSSYAYRVGGVCSTGDTVVSEWHVFTPGAVASGAVVCDAPDSLNIDTVGDNTAQIHWFGSDTVRYEIQVQTQDSIWGFILDSDSVKTTLTLTDLDAATDFEIRVRTLCGEEDSPFTEWTAFTTQPAMSDCMLPDSLMAMTLDDSTVTLSWIGPDSALFEVEVRRFDTVAVNVLQLQSATTSIDVSGLSEIFDYEFRVQSICDSGDTSGFTDWVLFSLDTTGGAPCNTPDSLTVDSVTASEALISWYDTVGQTYILQWQTLDTLTPFDRVDTVVGGMATLVDLLPATAYQVRVRAVCSAGESEFTDWMAFVTAEDSLQECTIPDSVVLDSVSFTQAYLSWMGADTATYWYEGRLAEMPGLLAFSGFTMGNQLALTNLSPGASYEIRVRTVCAANDSSAYSPYFLFQTLEDTVVVDTCATPMAMIEDITLETASMSWTASSANALYLIEVEHLGLTTPYQLIATTYDTSYLVEGLMPDGDYQWKVTAFCSVDAYSECTPWMDFSTLADSTEPACPQPSGLQVVQLSDGSATLAWNYDEDYLDYEVEVEHLDTTPFYNQISIVSDTTLVVDGLVPGGMYQFKVNALCANGELSTDSEWVPFGSMSEPEDTTVMSRPMAYHDMVFPNPVQDVMTVRMPITEEADATIVTLSDLAGRIVMEQRLDRIYKDEVFDFSVDQLREGMYQLLVRAQGRMYRQMIMVSE